LSGTTDDEIGDRIHGAIVRLRDVPLAIDDQSGLTLFDVAAKARSVRRKHGLGLLVIDYLQLMTGDGDNRNQQIEQISRGLKSLAKELAIPIIALSQLSRNCENRSNRRPIPSDLRESGAIEQDADVIAFVYRDEIYNPSSPDRGTAEIIVGKNRQGKTGTVRTAYIGEQTRFANLAHDWAPAAKDVPFAKARRGFSD
jgi:replicative DNA helicase